MLSNETSDAASNARLADGEVPNAPLLEQPCSVVLAAMNANRSDRRATFRLRAESSRPGAALRIFRIDHENWSFPK